MDLIDKIKGKKPLIRQVIKETTAGGIIYRIKDGCIEILLAQDSRDRWTIPKGHVEVGEITRQTAMREIQEETELKEMKILDQIGKTNFQYRRQSSLILMTTHVFLVEALGDTDKVRAVDAWMKGLEWLTFADALDKIHYEATETIMLIALIKIRERHGANLRSGL